jgi:hypothetical protein
MTTAPEEEPLSPRTCEVRARRRTLPHGTQRTEMEPLEARRSQRVRYRGTVEVRGAHSAGEDGPVRAEALDLGAGGMRIAAPLHVPVGAHVTCRLELDGHEAALPGRVAWLAHGGNDGDHGIGICFEPLGSYESAVVAHLLERSSPGFRPVTLRFAGVQRPIRARARPRAGGLRLSATLPILARGNELSFQLDEEGPAFLGRVGAATLHDGDDGTRRLEVDVDVPDHDRLRFRRKTRYGYAAEIQALEDSPPCRAGACAASVLPTSRSRLRSPALLVGSRASTSRRQHQPHRCAWQRARSNRTRRRHPTPRSPLPRP